MSENVIDQGGVTISTDARGVATIEFHHPLSNSLPGKVLRKLAQTIEDAGKDEKVKVILMKSAGERAFCAGASFDELVSIDDLETGKVFFSGFAGVINAIRKAPKFVLCRVQGKAVGGGVGLASAADYTFGTKHAAVKLSELAIGIGPFVVGPAVEKKIGNSAFSQMTIDATTWYSADWAREKGMYTSIHDSVEEMDSAINELLEKLSKSNPEAMQLLKGVFWEGTEHWDELLSQRAELSGKLVLSDFTRNAISKFKKGER
ncbi:MAG: methylglutaconyl-CoA hydratase [Bacteroidia bacterium]|jgi:methylglutaconyl-CoA hydratase